MSFSQFTYAILGIVLMIIAYLIWRIIEMFIPLKYKMKNIAGEIALVTGGAGGLGKSISLELSRLGAIVVIWDINQEAIEETIKLIKASGGIGYGYVCNIINRKDVYETAAMVKKEVGQVNILINNAGVCNSKSFMNTPDDLLARTMDVNITSQFWTVKAFLPEMIKSNKGHIVSIASVASHIAFPFLVDYCASKYALIGFYEALEKELNIIGCNVNTTIICPCFMHNTGMKAETLIRFSVLHSLSTEEVARKTVISMRCNKKMVLSPGHSYLFLMFKSIFPWCYDRLFDICLKLYFIPSIDDMIRNKYDIQPNHQES